MFAYLLRRIAVIIPTLIFVSILIFGLQQLLPGDPALALAGEDRDPKVIEFLRAKYHLDQPLPIRYGLWVSALLHGDLGESIRINRPVLELIVEKLPVTAELAGFSVELGIFPASGYVSPREDLRQNLSAMIMPAFVLGNAIAAVMMRHTRSAMLQVMSTDYIRTARAKGLDERVVILKHGLRNALVPVVTLGALEFGQLLSGAVLTEQVFTIPGFGKLIVDAVFNRDYAVVQGVVLFTATAYIFLNLLADLAYFLVNPRLRA